LEREEIVEVICSVQDTNAKGWLTEVFSILEHDELKRVVVTIWAICYARRKVVYENTLSTHHFVDSYIADLEMTTAPKERNKQTRISNNTGIPPPPSIAKINVDATISKNGGVGSVAAMARDSAGTFLGASALVVEGISNPEVMEAITCREGGALATDLFLQKVKMASDCNNVVKSFRDEALIWGHIIM
jgi:hypothetical protein